MTNQLRQALTRLEVRTNGRSFHNISQEINHWLNSENAGDGLVNILVRHTSASLTVQENADPDVRADLLDYFDDLAPEKRKWRHAAEGPDDMPAHAKSALTDVSLSIPVVDGHMDLGTWQGVYLIEHRHHGSVRTLSLCYQGN